METVKPKRVKFKDEEYWLVEGSPFVEYNLSPLDHFNADGELQEAAFGDISFAVVEDGGKIMRFGHQIGTLSDLEYLT